MKKITLLFFLLLFFLMFFPSKKSIPVYLEVDQKNRVNQYHIFCTPSISSEFFQNYFSKYEITSISIKKSFSFPQNISTQFLFDASSFQKNMNRIKKEYESKLMDYGLSKELARERLEGFYIEEVTLQISYEDLNSINEHILNGRCQIL